MVDNYYLLGGEKPTPLKNMSESQLGLLFPIYGKKCSKSPIRNSIMKTF